MTKKIGEEVLGEAKYKFLTIAEASKVLRVNRNVISNLIVSHRLKAYRVGKKYLIPTEAINELLKNNEV